MSHNIFQGKRVLLRAVRPSDWEAFHAMDEDTESARLGYHIPFPQSPEAVQKWAADKSVARPENDIFFFVIENEENQIVGSLGTHGCNRRNGTFEYGITIARPHWRKGYASEAIRLLLRYFFHELGYQKCTITAYAFNEASIELHKRLGFQHEGRMRSMIYTGGAYHDELLYGLTRDEFDQLQE